MILLKLKWQQINIMCYNNESHSVYDEDMENKRKILSLIIKKVWYIPLQQQQQQQNNNNSKSKQKCPHILSFCFGSQWVNSLAELRSNSILGFLLGIRRSFLLALIFTNALEILGFLTLVHQRLLWCLCSLSGVERSQDLGVREFQDHNKHSQVASN